ncbi:MAG: copper chaperone PCu(A)C [Chloroflexota bacterium]
MKRLFFITSLAALLLSACGAPGEIEVHQPWARSAMQGANSAVYFELHNHSDQDDELLGASSDVAEAVEIHLSSMNDQGMMQMAKQDSVALPVDAEILFAPGGLHVMLIGLTRDLKAGDHFQLTLRFKARADIVLDVVVQEMEGMDMGATHTP